MALLENGMSYIAKATITFVNLLQTEDKQSIGIKLNALDFTLGSAAYLIKYALLGYRMELQAIKDVAGAAFDKVSGAATSLIKIENPVVGKAADFGTHLIVDKLKSGFLSFIESAFKDNKLEMNRQDITEAFRIYLDEATGLVKSNRVKLDSKFDSDDIYDYKSRLCTAFELALQSQK